MNRSTKHRSQLGRRSTYAVFAANGLLFATWVSRLPAVRARLGATEPQLGAALLCIAIGSLVSMPLASRLCDRFGIGRVVTVAMAVAAVGFQLAVVAPSLAMLAAALVLIGATIGIWDVAMNASAHAAEHGLGRSLMPGFHGAFSLGGLSGAGLGALAAAVGLPVAVHMALGGAAVGVIGVVAGRHLLEPHGSRAAAAGISRHAGRRRRVPGRLVLLGLLAGCTALGEGAAADWAGLFLHDERGASEATAAIGYALFCLAMAAGRLSGNRTLARMTRVGALQASGLAITAALILLVAVDALPVALLAMVGWGLGVAIVFPAAMSAAAELTDRPAHGIAFVSTIGYGGFLVGPPAIGFVAGQVGLGVALWIVAILGLVLAGLAPAAGGSRGTQASSRCSEGASRPIRRPLRPTTAQRHPQDESLSV